MSNLVPLLPLSPPLYNLYLSTLITVFLMAPSHFDSLKSDLLTCSLSTQEHIAND